MLATVSTTVEITGLELDLQIEVSGEYADHGIGAFEYLGRSRSSSRVGLG